MPDASRARPRDPVGLVLRGALCVPDAESCHKTMPAHLVQRGERLAYEPVGQQADRAPRATRSGCTESLLRRRPAPGTSREQAATRGSRPEMIEGEDAVHPRRFSRTCNVERCGGGRLKSREGDTDLQAISPR